MPSSKRSSAAQDSSDNASVIDLQAWLFLIREKWLFIALCIVGMLALAVLYLRSQTPTYVAQAIVRVTEDAANIIKIDDVNSDNYKSDLALKSVESAFNSTTLLLRVVKANKLQETDPAFKQDAGERAKIDSELAGTLQKMVEAKLRRGTRNIEINVENTDPARAARVARSMVDEYNSMYFEENTRMATQANEFLQKQAEELRERVAKSEQALQEYREKYGTVSLEEKQNVTADYLKQLNFKLEEARSNRVKIEADVPKLQNHATQPLESLLAVQSVAEFPEVQDTLKLITAKESEFSQIKKRYLGLHPKYIQTESELQGLQQTLEKSARKGAAIVLNTYQAALDTEEKLKLAMQEQQNKGVELSRLAIPYGELKRQAESDQILYESVLTRVKETKLSERLDRSNIRLVQDPLAPRFPSKPNRKLVLGFAFALGLGLSLLLIILSHAFDTSLRSVDQAESVLNLNSLAAVPELKIESKDTDPLVMLGDPSSRQAEAFRNLRTALTLLPAGAPQVTLFTSAIPSEGKSFCSANYAVSLAQQNTRTLLIDADLRKPGLGVLFSPPPDAPGISEVLSGQASFDAACHGTKMENLTFMPAGKRNQSPLELLTDDRFANLIREARGKFDRIVLDTAPINAVSDTLLIVKHADAVTFVVRARKTPARSLVRALQQLDGANATPVGFVLNRLPTKLGDYYYYDAGKYSSAGVYGT